MGISKSPKKITATVPWEKERQQDKNRWTEWDDHQRVITTKSNCPVTSFVTFYTYEPNSIAEEARKVIARKSRIRYCCVVCTKAHTHWP
jgi:hypothetical protein